MHRIETFPKTVAERHHPYFLVSGDDPFLSEDALQQLVMRARLQHADVSPSTIRIQSASDWPTLSMALASQSLLQPQKIIICRFKASMLPAQQDRHLRTCLEKIPSSTCLYLITPKLTAAQKKKASIQFFDHQKRHLVVWPMQERSCQTWIKHRANGLHLDLTTAQCAQLTLSCQHEPMQIVNALNILAISYSGTKVPNDALSQHWGTASTHGMFQIIDHALTGHSNACMHGLQQHRAQNNTPIGLLYALHKTMLDAHTILQLAQNKIPLEQAIKHVIKWPSKQRLYQQYLQRSCIKDIDQLLQCIARIEKTLKGVDTSGQVWHQLDHLLYTICHTKHLSALHQTFSKITR